MGIKFIISGILLGIAAGRAIVAPRGEDTARSMEAGGLQLRLSEYHVFEGRPSDLKPAAGFQVYDLATTLFTDYAEK